MTSSNAWADFAAVFARTRPAYLEHDEVKAELKRVVPEDARQAIGYGVRARRSKSGAIGLSTSSLLKGRAVQQSSPSIGTLASALTKAQTRKKSLIATIRTGGPKGTEQTFRYAPLSSGLDIVRKILGQHEIATVQTTSVDQNAGMINLTTVLAHASGEWIPDGWWVCPMSETSHSPADGAALTCARRYALFTLDGLPARMTSMRLICRLRRTRRQARETETTRATVSSTAHSGIKSVWQWSARLRRSTGTPKSDPWEPKPSAQLRDRLLEELNALGSSEGAAKWAHRQPR